MGEEVDRFVDPSPVPGEDRKKLLREIRKRLLKAVLEGTDRELIEEIEWAFAVLSAIEDRGDRK